MLCFNCVFVFQLIKLNSPDLVLFVGEALVGNEAVDQLKKFNQALADFSMAENPRLIDGILLTKFDTIDDKVTSRFSLCYPFTLANLYAQNLLQETLECKYK